MIVHEAKCAGCGKREKAEAIYGGPAYTSICGLGSPTPDYGHPPKWLRVGGEHACSWKCVGCYAEKQERDARGTEAVKAKPSERKARSRRDAPKAKGHALS